MTFERNEKVWHATLPTEWPDIPKWMSYSSLLEIETCPKRWVLKSAYFPDIWSKRGYPTKPFISALKGTVVHLALKYITNILGEKGVKSVNEKKAFITLKEEGGFSNILRNFIDRAINKYQENPRAKPNLDMMRQSLISSIPSMRTNLQTLLSRITFVPRQSIGTKNSGSKKIKSRNKLLKGSYSETEIRASGLGWYGIADLISLDVDNSEIRDFKTGEHKTDHELQIIIYALLWHLDHELNPSGRYVDKLVLSYVDKDVEVPTPTKDELMLLEKDIKDRTEAVISTIINENPKAQPSKEGCSYCPVKQICDEYWKWQNLNLPEESIIVDQYSDIQIKLISKNGPRSWNGIVESSEFINVGEQILLRTSNLPFDLKNNQIIRILNVQLSTDEEFIKNDDLSYIATMGNNTEVFEVLI